MTETILLDIQSGTAQAVGNAIRAWRPNPDDDAPDAEAVFRECLASMDGLRRTLHTLWEAAARGEGAADTARLVPIIQGAFDSTIATLTVARDRAWALEDAGCRVEGVADLQAALAEAEQLRDLTLAIWPLVDTQTSAQAREACHRGEFETPGAALKALLTARHLARLSPSHEQLRELARRSPPPAAWYQEGEPRS